MEKRPAEATLFRNGRTELCPHAHRESFVRIRTGGECCWPTFTMSCSSAWSALTEQLMINGELAPRVGVREETILYQHALLLNVYMLISSLKLFNWLINLFLYSQPNETAPCSEFWKLVFSIKPNYPPE